MERSNKLEYNYRITFYITEEMLKKCEKLQRFQFVAYFMLHSKRMGIQMPKSPLALEYLHIHPVYEIVRKSKKNQSPLY